MISTLAFFVGYYNVKTHYKGRHLLSTFASLPYAMPGTVLAFAIILQWPARDAMLMIGLAYLVKYLSYGVKVFSPAIANVHKSLEEASLVSGASWPKTLYKIWLPVLRSSFTTTCFLVFAPLFSELTMSIILIGPGQPTIGARLFQLQEYESPNQACVLAVIILTIVIGLNAAVKKMSRGKLGV